MEKMYLEECCDILDSMRIPITASDRKEGPYPNYGANGVQEHVAYYIFDDELVLLAEDGGNFGSKEKPIAYRVSGKCWVNNHAHVLKPKEGLNVDYLCYSLMFYNTEGLVNGATRQKLTQATMRKMLIPSRTMQDQLRIVSILNKVSCTIQLRKQELEALDTLIKARFVEMFGDGYPEDTLLNLCHIIDYRGKTPEKAESGLPFITAKNIKMHQMNMEPREYISKKTYDKVMVRGFPKEGDVVFTTEAPLGNVCRIPHFETEFYIGQRIVTLQTEKLIPAYLEYALSTDSFKQKYMGQSSGSTVTGIRVRLLEQLTIPVPPTELQKQFSAFITQVDKLKVVVQKALDEAQLLFDSLMQQYFG